jgi:hypothetical protein
MEIITAEPGGHTGQKTKGAITMNKYQEYQANQERLWAERRQRLDAQKAEKKSRMMPKKTVKEEPKKQKEMYQVSRTGMLHIIDTEMTGQYEKNLAKCQSYNLDTPNYLEGMIFLTTESHSRLCKKCFGK